MAGGVDAARSRPLSQGGATEGGAMGGTATARKAKRHLQKSGRAGRKSFLEERDRQQLERLLVRGEAMGYETPLPI